jgi:CubicO group peptidase (beta-lactamase class C family)
VGAALLLALSTLLAGCIDTGPSSTDPSSTGPDLEVPEQKGLPNQHSGLPITKDQIDAAIDAVPELVQRMMDEHGVPGVSVAVVKDGETVLAEGFGVREKGKDEKVNADTVFQLASVSKSVGATVVAQQVGESVVGWDTRIVEHLPWVALSDPDATENVSIEDLYAHRSGLPEHVGDDLEDVGFSRQAILERLRHVPLAPFRAEYHYGNFGMTAAAVAVAAAAGQEWEELSETVLYEPLGMSSTSSSYDDFIGRENKATGHVTRNGEWQITPEQRNPDAQSPAGGVSSSANDMALWMTLVLGEGSVDGEQIVESNALAQAIQPVVVKGDSAAPDARGNFYGLGFDVDDTSAGRVLISHSGAFSLGAATTFALLPSEDIGIVVLTNGEPHGYAETLSREFMDLVQFGSIQEDWLSLYSSGLEPGLAPRGELVGKNPPAGAAAAQPNTAYIGTYANDYFGPVEVTETGAGSLQLLLGPDKQPWPLTHWDGDVFTFSFFAEGTPEGSISQAKFAGDELTLEAFDESGLGTFEKQPGAPSL